MGKQALVIGSPIAHSRSPLLHNTGYKALQLSDWSYGRQECTAEQLPELVASLPPEVQGISVTMPCKFAALEFADAHSERAQAIGSANTLVRQADGSWWADNTDVAGVAGCLEELFPASAEKELSGGVAVIFGSGGTARPAIWACCAAGVSEIIIVNRRDRSAEFSDLQQYFPQVRIQVAVLESFGSLELAAYSSTDFGKLQALAGLANVAINTIPAANTAAFAPLFADVPLIDVIYDPWPTPLYAAGKQVIGGYVMLAYQAFEQFELFTGHTAPRAAMLSALTADLGIYG